MTQKINKKSSGFFFIIPGIILIIVRFIGDSENWSIVDIIKVLVGALMVIYGVWILLKKE